MNSEQVEHGDHGEPNEINSLGTFNNKTVILEGQYALIKLPSAGMKVIQLKHDAVISLGKFGTFNANEILGFPFGQSFEIIGDNKVKPIKSLTEAAQPENEESGEPQGDEPEEITKDKLTQMFSNNSENNQNIINIGSKIQKLTNDDINELKKSGATSNIGQLIIQKMIEGHEGFDKKTIFSQQKYLKRKQQKFLRRFTVEFYGTSQMFLYYLEKDSSRLLDMSEETLGLLMTYSNVRPGGKYLLLDETGGVVLHSMLERMDCQGSIVMVHENEHANYSALKNCNISEATITNCVNTINWLQVVEPEAERIDFEYINPEELSQLKAPKRSQYYKRQKRAETINKAIDMFQQGNFDGFISVSSLDPISFLPLMVPKVGGSRAITIYSQFKEVLLDVQHSMSNDKRILAPSIFETRARPYQTIPGRIHPLMTMRGYGGYVLWGTRVFPKESVQAVGRGVSKKRNNSPGAAREGNETKKMREGNDMEDTPSVET